MPAAFRNPLGDYWLIRQSDAHAWTEVWLQGRGWIRIDPTAAVDAGSRLRAPAPNIGGGLAEGLLGAFGGMVPAS
jgi:protein-glutamine gamma-glutamyltransferase